MKARQRFDLAVELMNGGTTSRSMERRLEVQADLRLSEGDIPSWTEVILEGPNGLYDSVKKTHAAPVA